MTFLSAEWLPQSSKPVDRPIQICSFLVCVGRFSGPSVRQDKTRVEMQPLLSSG